MRRILILAAGDPFYRHIDKLKEHGYYVVALDRDPTAKGGSHADAFVVAGVDDVDAIESAARTHQIDAIIAVTEAGVRAASEASHRLGLPGLPIDVARAATDKAAMRRRWQAAGLAQPYFLIANTTQEAADAIARVGLPFVIKPTHAWSSKGVSAVLKESEIEQAVSDAFAVHGGPAIIERFVPGRLLTAEGFVSDGDARVVAIGDVETQEIDRHRVNMSLQYPGNFSEGVLNEAAELIRRAALALGLVRSPFHCECIVGPQGIHLVEMAARGGGGHIFTILYEPMTGFSGILRQARLLLGEEVADLPSRLSRGGCYRFLSAPAGIVDQIGETDEAAGMPGVLDLGISIKVGERGGAVSHDNARHGHVCTIGADRDEALERAKAAASAVLFVMRPA